MTKRFANPARSRATRGRENAWLEAPTSSSAWPTRTTKQDDRYDDAFTLPSPLPCSILGRPVPSPNFFFSANFSSNFEQTEGDSSWETIVGQRRPRLDRHVGDAVGIGAATAEVSKRGTARVNRKPTTPSTRSLPPPPRLRLLGSVEAHPRARTSYAPARFGRGLDGW